MKTRKCFVSNSSSSSFIIGVGRVTDANKAFNFIKNLNTDRGSVHIETAEAIGLHSHWEPVQLQTDGLEHFGNVVVNVEYNDTYQEVILPVASCDDLVFTVAIDNNEGDGVEGSDFYEACYCDKRPLEEDYYSHHQRKLFNVTEAEHGIADYRYKIGADRNG